MSTANMKSSKKYMPPAMRKINNNICTNTTTYTSTKKKELKKEPDFQDTLLFPSLGETLKNEANPKKILSFSAVAAKKIEQPKLLNSGEVVPTGWVYIRQHKGKIQYKTGDLNRLYNWLDKEEARTDLLIAKRFFQYQIARDQYERDIDILCRGDLSEYYGELTLEEQYALERQEELNQENNESSSNEESDSDYYN